jgi:hypothetical protein
MGIPANQKVYFMLPPDCRNSQWHTERTIRRRHLLSLLSSDSINFHMIKDPLNICLLTEPRMLHSVSRPLQTGIRFSRGASACAARSGLLQPDNSLPYRISRLSGRLGTIPCSANTNIKKIMRRQ